MSYIYRNTRGPEYCSFVNKFLFKEVFIMFNGSGASLADIAAVVGRNNNGFGGDGGGWWALIIILALFGWGDGNGGIFGNRGGGSSATTTAIDASLQRGFDTQSIISKLDGITNGICNLGYDQLSQMNNLNTNIMQTGWNVTQAINQAAVADTMQGNALATQIQQCCCNLENLFAQANYNRATDTCAITTAIKDAVTAINANNDCNYRSLYNQQVELQMQGKDAQIAQLTAALNRCDQQTLAQSVVNQLTEKAPVAAYMVPNPNVPYPFPYNMFNNNWNNGNGCCNGNWAYSMAG